MDLGLPNGGLYTMTDIVRERERRLTVELSNLGLTLHEWRALRILSNFAGAVAMSEVVKYSQTDRTAFGRTIDRLVARGWVVRTPSLVDKRAVLLRTTAESKSSFLKAFKVVNQFDVGLMGALDEDERAHLDQLLTKIFSAFDSVDIY